MLEQAHNSLHDKEAIYYLNPISYSYNGFLYFQSSGSHALKASVQDFPKGLLAYVGNMNYVQVQFELLKEMDIEDLINHNIIIRADFFQEVVSGILDDINQIIGAADSRTKLSIIFPYSNTTGFWVVSVLKAAVLLKRTFKLTRYSTNGIQVEFENGYCYNTTSDNCFKENVSSIRITKSKSLSSSLLRTYNICVPDQCKLKSDDEHGASELLRQWGFPLCIKPDDLAESIDVFPNIQSEKDFWGCWNYMRQKNAKIIIEKSINGPVFRLYYVYGPLNIMVYKENSFIAGDGIHPIFDLINTKYGFRYCKTYQHDITRELEVQNKKMNDIPEKNTIVKISTVFMGGRDFHVSYGISCVNRALLERVAKAIHMNIFAIDVIAKEGDENNPYVIEIQESPEFDQSNPAADMFYYQVVKKLSDMQKPCP